MQCQEVTCLYICKFKSGLYNMAVQDRCCMRAWNYRYERIDDIPIYER